MSTPAEAGAGSPGEELVQLRRRDPRRYTRWRVATLVAVHVLAAAHVAHWLLAGRTLAPLELNEVLHTVHAGILTVGFVFMALAVVVTAVLGRFFCSWGCHLLALQDLSAWLLGRLRVRARPIRSRALVLVAPLAMLYLFAWPELDRWLAGRAHPPLVIQGDGQGWASFVTTDLWRNLPGAGVAVATLLACGFAVVYLLGSRAFCHYACPYGVVFRAADHVAPGRIVLRGGCPAGCAACTAVCQSQVRVHEEVAEAGMIVNSRCLKDLDCVAACPTGALRYRLVRPPALRRGPALAARRYDLSPGEEALAGGVCLAAVLALRGLYDTVPFLLSLGLGAAMAALALGAWRVARRRGDVKVGPVLARRGGRLTRAGAAYLAVALASAALVAHSGVVRAHEWLGARALERAVASARGSGPATVEDLDVARAHLEWCARWGLVEPVALSRRLAVVAQLSGDPAAAAAGFRGVLAAAPDDHDVRVRLGRALLALGRVDEASAELARVIAAGEQASAAVRADAHEALATVRLRAGDPPGALGELRAALALDPARASVHVALGAVHARAGELERAASHLRRAASLAPASSTAWNDLGVVLGRLGRVDEALSAHRTAVRVGPRDAAAHANLGVALANAGRLDPARAELRRALVLDPADRGAREALAAIGATDDAAR